MKVMHFMSFSNFDLEINFCLYTKFGVPGLLLTGFKIMKIYQINKIKTRQVTIFLIV